MGHMCVRTCVRVCVCVRARARACVCVCMRTCRTEPVVLQVKPTPPPTSLPPGSMSPPTRAHLLRCAANHAAMQRHADAVFPTAHGSHDRHIQPKTLRRKSARHAAVSSHSRELHDVYQDSPNDLIMAPATEMLTEDASATGSVSKAADVDCGGVQDLVEIADKSALLKNVSAHVPVEKSSICCCVPDRLVAIHVRSELTESHFDM